MNVQNIGFTKLSIGNILYYIDKQFKYNYKFLTYIFPLYDKCVVNFHGARNKLGKFSTVK